MNVCCAPYNGSFSLLQAVVSGYNSLLPWGRSQASESIITKCIKIRFIVGLKGRLDFECAPLHCR